MLPPNKSAVRSSVSLPLDGSLSDPSWTHQRLSWPRRSKSTRRWPKRYVHVPYASSSLTTLPAKCRNTSETRHPPPSPMPTRHRRRPRRTRVARAVNSWRSSCLPTMPLPPPLRGPRLGPMHPRRDRRPRPRRLQRALIPATVVRQAAQPTQRTYKRPLQSRASRNIDARRGAGSATSDYSIFVPAYGRPRFRGRDSLVKGSVLTCS